MLATTAIRDACIRATAFKTHIFQSTFASNQSQTHQAPNGELIPGMADLTENQVENAKLLLQLSNETLLSDNALLIHADPSYGLPMLVGLTLLFNTELSASIRAQFIKARAQSASPASPVPPSVATNAVTRSSGASRNVSTQFKKTARPLKVDSPHRRNHQQTVPTNAETDTPDALQVADSKFTPALRLLSIGMIVVATQAPMVCPFSGCTRQS